METVAPALEAGAFDKEPTRRQVVLRMALIAVCLGGLQVTWSVEMSFGTPLLYSLGLPKSLIALVWIAGPLTGMLCQPLSGVLSDRSRLRMGKRRPFLLGALVACEVWLCMFGLAQALAGTEQGSGRVLVAPLALAIAGLYGIDFSVNFVTASARALMVDTIPAAHLTTANSMCAISMGIGNILGFVAASANLTALFPWLTQFQGLLLLAGVLLAVCIGVACYAIPERDASGDPRDDGSLRQTLLHFFAHLIKSARRLPRLSRQVCLVQLCSWVGWFPILFYSTSYVGGIYVQSQMADGTEKSDIDWEYAARIGSISMLLFAVVSLVVALLAPLVTQNPEQTSSNAPRRPYQITLPQIWCAACLLFSIDMAGTFFVYNVYSALAVIAVAGIPWGITMWVPFALITYDISTTTTTYQRLDQAPSDSELGDALSSSDSELAPVEAGTVLGIHNFFISCPQVISTLVASILFLESKHSDDVPNSMQAQGAGVEWVLRCGGVASLAAAYFASRIRLGSEQ